MKATLIIIGDEILSGRTRDINGFWLAGFLSKVGISLSNISVVQDDEQSIHNALEIALNSNEIVFTSGGLGPTKDDITKNVLANYFNKDIIQDNESIELVTNLYKKFDRPWTTETNDYHFYPKDFQLTDNLNGFAPGLCFFNNGKALFSAPGVPREFSSMVENIFLPLIKDSNPKDILIPIKLLPIRTRGIPEEKIFSELCPNLWNDLSKVAKVSSLPHLLGVDIVLYIEEINYEEKSKEVKEIIAKTDLPQFIWQYGELELEELIVKICREKNITIGFAESCTGGLTSSKITNVSGSSSVFLGSVISYANEVKTNLLNVKEQTLINFGAVSTECAKEMAKGAREVLKSDYAISFTGIAGPGGGTEQKPVGTVGIGWSGPNETSSEVLNFKGDRIGLKERFSRAGLFKLLDQINSH
jgi:nicotinamide-nucleotide amidase